MNASISNETFSIMFDDADDSSTCSDSVFSSSVSSSSDWMSDDDEEDMEDLANEMILIHQQSRNALLFSSQNSSHQHERTVSLCNQMNQARCLVNEEPSPPFPSLLLKRMQQAESVGPTVLNLESASLTSPISKTPVGMDLKIETPNDFYFFLLQRNGVSAKPINALEEQSFFLEMTDDNMDAYTMAKTVAVKSDNVQALTDMHNNGELLQCCNQFGESILHSACRHGSLKSLQFLVETAKVSLNVMDDYGRNPLHDACWTSTPQWDIINILLENCPDLFLAADKRGFTPLQYARKEHWNDWKTFLEKHEEKLLPKFFHQTVTLC